MSALEYLFGEFKAQALINLAKKKSIPTSYGVDFELLDTSLNVLNAQRSVACFAPLPPAYRKESLAGKVSKFFRYTPRRCKVQPIKKWVNEYLEIGLKWGIFPGKDVNHILNEGVIWDLQDPTLTIRRFYLGLCYLRPLDEHPEACFRLVELRRLFPRHNVSSLFCFASAGPFAQPAANNHTIYPVFMLSSIPEWDKLSSGLKALESFKGLDSRSLLDELVKSGTTMYSTINWDLQNYLWGTKTEVGSTLLLLTSRIKRALKNEDLEALKAGFGALLEKGNQASAELRNSIPRLSI